MMPIRILLADDHTLIRAGLRSLLQGLPDIQVVAEASDGREALALVEAHRPDVMLMDIAMPGLNGLQATALVAREYPGTRVIILSMHRDEEYVRQAVLAGALGYLLKDSGTAELELAIRAVIRREPYLCSAVSKYVLADYARYVGGEPGPDEPLTRRQREVLRLIAEGQTTKSMARALGISVKTVETHRAQLMDRLGIHDVAGLVRHAIRIGLVKPEP